ncbi:MAG TPA: MBL fold metallo-hydrolase [Nocardioides sp.]|uniref:MBL fold metallo-hydrolase n=1 Tax=Nocardioides sp. TaxID=35761 RepID=UPI002E35150A|nr:MBL fold metallo-hydrolase [Nocardioides sp.]HEX3930020.1 MBL fold metallo-hydrolase [Nocardioides sp.]
MQAVGETQWFRRSEVGDGISMVEEPYVDPLLAANIWHVRGRDRDLVVDSGLGIVSLRTQLPWLFEHDPVVVLTHAHLDHMGGASEFADCRVHAAEAAEVRRPGAVSLHGTALLEILGLDAGDEPVPDLLLEALPRDGYDPAAYALHGAPEVTELADGDVVDLGDRRLRVLHLPGHTPGSINLYDADAGQLFTGDVLYDDGLIDTCIGSDVDAYVASMRLLLDLPVERAFPGHGRVLDGGDVRRVAAGYLRSRGADPESRRPRP